MKRICIIVFIVFFTLSGFMSGCSNEGSKQKLQAIKGKKSLEEKSFEKTPKAPASALNGVGEGELFDEEHNASSE